MTPSNDLHSIPSHSSSTSLAPSTPPTSILHSNSNLSRVSFTKPQRRASNGALADICSKDLPSFLRPNTKPKLELSRLSPPAEDSQDHKFVSPDYAQAGFRTTRDQDQLDLLQMLKEKDNEKPTKKENRFYGFFGRSSSRSRSKKRWSRSAEALPFVEAPLPDVPSHSHHTSFGRDENDNVLRDHTSSKPTAISPSRPLSSTTTATNATITQHKSREKHPPDPVSVTRTTYAPSLSAHDHEIDEPIKSRKKTFFGIPIPTPRIRSVSSRSRPNTPKQPPDHQQLKNLERVTSAPSRAHHPPLPMNNSTNLRSTDEPSLLTYSFDISEPDSGLGLETVSPSKPIVLAPQPRPPHTLAPTNSQVILDVPKRVSSSPPRLEKGADTPIPKVPNPKRESSSGRSSPLTGLFKGKERESSNRVTSPTIVGLERRSSRSSTKREGSTTSRTIGTIGTPKIPKGRIKHGSFDFERPISSSVGTRGGFQNPPSSHIPSVSEFGKVSSDSHWKAHSTTYVIEEEGPSLIRNHSGRSSSSRATTEQRIRFEDPPLTRSAQASTNGSASSHSQLPLPHSHQTKAVRPLPPLPPRADSAATGQSSSWGRATGMRNAVGIVHGVHPTFSFESATAQKPDKFGPGRATGKGRSLDLGIELNWAPSRVREEAVMKTKARWREEAEVKESGRSQVAESFEKVLGENGYAKFREYVHRFDARLMPLDGPSGLIYKVQRLLDTTAPGLDPKGKRDLLERFDQVVQQNR